MFLTAVPSFLSTEVPTSLPHDEISHIPSSFLGPIHLVDDPSLALSDFRWLFPNTYVLRSKSITTFSLPSYCESAAFFTINFSCRVTSSTTSEVFTFSPGSMFCLPRVSRNDAFTFAPVEDDSELLLLIVCDNFPFFRRPNNLLVFNPGFCYLRWFIANLGDHDTFCVGSLLGAYPLLSAVYVKLVSVNITHLSCSLSLDCRTRIHHVRPRSAGLSVPVDTLLLIPDFPCGGEPQFDISNNECLSAVAGARIRLDPSSRNLLSAVGFTEEKDCADVVKSLFVDRNSRLRLEVDKLLASRWSDEKFSHQRSRKRVTIYQQLTTSEERALEASYPEFDISFNPQQFVAHAFAAASRKLETELLISLCGYSKSSKPPRGFKACIIDIGGNYPVHIMGKRNYIHSCCPILSAHDDLREATRREMINNIYLPPLPAPTDVSCGSTAGDSGEDYSHDGLSGSSTHSVRVTQDAAATLHHLVKMFRDRRTRCRIRCNKKAQDCRVPAPQLISVHSAYDMTPEDLCLSMLSHNATTLRGSLIFSPEILTCPTGTLQPLGCVYVRDDTKDTITFAFTDDPSLTYTHKFSSYRRLFSTTSVTVGSPPVRFYIDLQRNRCGVQFFTIRRGIAAEVPESTFSRNLWLPTAENKLAVRYYSFNVRATSLRDALVPRYFSVPRGHFEKIFQYALRLSDQKFNVNDLFNYACSINNRLIIDGASVNQPESICTEDLVDLTHATYIYAYCKRYNLGRIDKEVIRTIQDERALSSSGCLKKLLLLLRTPFSKFSLLSGLDELLNRWIVLRDSFPIAIEDSVRFVTYSTLCEKFVNDSDTSVWDYEAIFEDDCLEVSFTAQPPEDSAMSADTTVCDETSSVDGTVCGGSGNAAPVVDPAVKVLDSKLSYHTDNFCGVNFNDVLFCTSTPIASSRFFQAPPSDVADVCYIVSGCSDGNFLLVSDDGECAFVGDGNAFQDYVVEKRKREKGKKNVSEFVSSVVSYVSENFCQQPIRVIDPSTVVFVAREQIYGNPRKHVYGVPPTIWVVARERWERNARLYAQRRNADFSSPDLSYTSWDPRSLPVIFDSTEACWTYSLNYRRALNRLYRTDDMHFANRPWVERSPITAMDRDEFNLLCGARYAFCRTSVILLHLDRPHVPTTGDFGRQRALCWYNEVPTVPATTDVVVSPALDDSSDFIRPDCAVTVTPTAPEFGCRDGFDSKVNDTPACGNFEGTEGTNVTTAAASVCGIDAQRTFVNDEGGVEPEVLGKSCEPPTSIDSLQSTIVDSFPFIIGNCSHRHRLVKSSPVDNMCFYNSLIQCLGLRITGEECKEFLLRAADSKTIERSTVERLLRAKNAAADTAVVFHSARAYKVRICLHYALDNTVCRLIVPDVAFDKTICILQVINHFDSLICRTGSASRPCVPRVSLSGSVSSRTVEFVPQALNYTRNPIAIAHPSLISTLFEEYRSLSDVEKRDYLDFKPVELSGDSLVVKVKNAVAEQLEYWRIYDGVLRANLREIFVNLPLSFSARDRDSYSQGSKAVCVWDCHEGVWLVPPRQGVKHEYGYNGEDYVALQGKLGKCPILKDKLKHTGCNRIVCTRDTELLQEHRLLKASRNISLSDFEELPEFNFINGVPGCGKTTFIINNHRPSQWSNVSKDCPVAQLLSVGDLVLTATREAAADLRGRLSRSGIRADKFQYRTIDSFILNREDKTFEALWVDEALMSHAGSVFICAKLSGAKKVHLIGDRKQIPYIPRLPGIKLKYFSLSDILPVSLSLHVSFRCPIDVAAVLHNEYQPGMKTTNRRRRSMRLEKINSLGNVPKRREGVQYLTFTQAEKHMLAEKGYHPVSTVHEFQGKACPVVWVVRTSHRTSDEIYKQESHALVAMSRHTQELVYYTPVLVDALGKRVSAEVSAADAQRATAAEDFAPPKLVGGGEFFLTPPTCGTSPQPTVGIEENLQTWYDSILHRDSTEDMSYDQHHVHHSDLSLALQNISLKLNRDAPLGDNRPTLIPRLRTGATAPRHATQRETLLGFYKRNANVPDLQGLVADERLVEDMRNKFIDAFVSPRKRDLFASYATRKIVPSSIAIESWLRTQPQHVADQIVSDARAPWEKAINEYLYMNKREIKPSLDGTASTEYKAVQTIAYNTKDINAVFCPIFRQISDRLLSVLDDRFLIYTQLSVEEFEERLTNILPTHLAGALFTKEVDFSKYDKSQGRVHLMFEIAVYKALGLDPYYAYLWYQAHFHTVVKDPSCGFLAWLQYQRKSGDAATFIGNTIVLMGMLSFMYDFKNVSCGLFGGDDSVLWGKRVMLEQDRTFMASDVFNMEAKFFKFRSVYFSSKFLVPVGDRWRFIPDPLKIVFKLGRHDLVDWTHLEEYFISMKDHLKCFRDACINEVLSDAVTERYNTRVSDHTHCFAALSRLSEDKEAFFALFTDPGCLLIDPSRPKVF